ncbi:hypothetical protein MCOR27_009682 [Pyricularia oryzae]|nr:hypothetical protein MCOR27_009682 [Pyricularia oryzae]KAI6549664.1 hypothetical protein MCOR09_011482 [Pyricularia oryzae]KAI6617195.1 hypothetical protein MCOR14_010855 [Pyricularia oryzae]
MTTSAPRKTVNFITGNQNKLAEVQAILEPTIEVQSQKLDLIEVQGTLEEVTLDKVRRAAEQVEGPVLVEDTCLCFNALKGLPGPYIKWFMQSIGHDGLNNLLAAYEDKSAQAVCTFGYSAGPGSEPILFQGITEAGTPSSNTKAKHMPRWTRQRRTRYHTEARLWRSFRHGSLSGRTNASSRHSVTVKLRRRL